MQKNVKAELDESVHPMFELACELDEVSVTELNSAPISDSPFKWKVLES